MKFYELTALLTKIIEKEKKDKKGSPSLRFIVMAYNNVLKTIYDEYSDNEAVTDKKIESLELTKHMTEKLLYLSDTNITKKMSDEFKRDRQENMLKQSLLDLLGIGTKKVNELIDAGLINIKQIHQKRYLEMLNIDTQLDIIHQPVHNIDHSDVKKLEDKLTNFKKSAILTGSYSRKKPTVGDIDILLLANSQKDIDKYSEYLSEMFDNNVWIYANGPNKISLIFQPDSRRKYKADIFIANKSNYHSMLLYTTGSKNFNIRMRAKARKMGLLLNQNGIFDANHKKVNKDTDDEKILFKILDMDYVLPEKRF